MGQNIPLGQTKWPPEGKQIYFITTSDPLAQIQNNHNVHIKVSIRDQINDTHFSYYCLLPNCLNETILLKQVTPGLRILLSA